MPIAVGRSHDYLFVEKSDNSKEYFLFCDEQNNLNELEAYKRSIF